MCMLKRAFNMKWLRQMRISKWDLKQAFIFSNAHASIHHDSHSSSLHLSYYLSKFDARAEKTRKNSREIYTYNVCLWCVFTDGKHLKIDANLKWKSPCKHREEWSETKWNGATNGTHNSLFFSQRMQDSEGWNPFRFGWKTTLGEEKSRSIGIGCNLPIKMNILNIP